MDLEERLGYLEAIKSSRTFSGRRKTQEQHEKHHLNQNKHSHQQSQSKQPGHILISPSIAPNSKDPDEDLVSDILEVEETKDSRTERYFLLQEPREEGRPSTLTGPLKKSFSGSSNNDESAMSSSIDFDFPFVMHQSFSDFVANDQNYLHQRRILWQQSMMERDRKSASGDGKKNFKSKKKIVPKNSQSSSKISKEESTPGLWPELLPAKLKRRHFEGNVSSWPQYEDSLLIQRLQRLRIEECAKSTNSRNGGSGLWSILFQASNSNSNSKGASRAKRIFPEPAYVVHLATLKVKDEDEQGAVKVLRDRLPSLTVLKKFKLKGMVNELFLRGLEKSFEHLCLLLILEAGFPEDWGESIFGAVGRHSNRFPTYLMMAVALGQLKVVKGMLEGKAQGETAINRALNETWFNGLNPLILAQFSNCPFPMTQLLLKHGADPGQGIPYFTYLRCHVYLRRITAKTEVGAAIIPARPGRSVGCIYRRSVLFPLDFAVILGNYEVARRLLTTSRLNEKSWLERDEFVLLNTEDAELAADILKEAPELIKQRDPRGNTPLHAAAKRGRSDLIALYLHYGLGADVLNQNHCSPLHEAANGGHRAAVQYLISRGADCSIKTVGQGEGWTPLQLARKQGISSEELYDFFHATDTLQRTHHLLKELINRPSAITYDAKTPNESSAKGKRRLLIQKLLKYPKKLWWRNKESESQSLGP